MLHLLNSWGMHVIPQTSFLAAFQSLLHFTSWCTCRHPSANENLYQPLRLIVPCWPKEHPEVCSTWELTGCQHLELHCPAQWAHTLYSTPFHGFDFPCFCSPFPVHELAYLSHHAWKQLPLHLGPHLISHAAYKRVKLQLERRMIFLMKGRISGF